MTRKELEQILLEHCYSMSILKATAEIKKQESILDALIAAIIRSDTSFEDVKLCITEIKADTVFNLDFFEKGGNIFAFIEPKWHNFAKALYRQRSVGLGTPNEASGEGELMFLFLSPKIEKPTSGDLSVNNKIIELKGEGTRVLGKISGKDFRTKTLQICEKFKLTPNKANRTNLDAVEIEKTQHQEHWQKELKKLSLENQKHFISEYLTCIDNQPHNVDNLFIPNFDFEKFRKEIVKILFSSMVQDGNFEKFIMLGDGSNVKIFSNDISKFNDAVDNGNIVIGEDYFRINQIFNIGWYIS